MIRSPSDLSCTRFECAVEDFHSSLDQVELNLKCAAETTSQATASSRYMLANLSYHQVGRKISGIYFNSTF